MYEPDDFGAYALFMAIVSIFTTIATARYEMAIMLPENSRKAAPIVALSVIIAFCISIFLTIFIAVFYEKILLFTGEDSIGKWLYFVPLSVFIAGVYQALTYWFNRNKMYKNISYSRVNQALTTSAVNVGGGIYNSNYFGLILGSILGQIVSMLYLLRKSIKELLKYKNDCSHKELIESLKKYSDNPKYAAPSALLDAASIHSPNFFINNVYGASILGQYNLTFRLINAPLSIFSSSISQVYYQRISEFNNRGEKLNKFVCKTALYLLLIVLLPTLLIVFYGPIIFYYIFGANWVIAGEMAQILIFAFAVRFVVSPLSTIFFVKQKIKIAATWQTIYFMTIITTLFIATNYSLVTFIIIFTIHEIILYLVYFILILHVSNKSDI